MNNPNSAEIGPFFGWLCTRISFYQEETLRLKIDGPFRGGGLRPSSSWSRTTIPWQSTSARGSNWQGVGNRALLHAGPRRRSNTPEKLAPVTSINTFKCPIRWCRLRKKT